MRQGKDKVVKGVRIRETQETVLRSYRLPVWLDQWLSSRVKPPATQTDSVVGILMERHEQEAGKRLDDKIKAGSLRK